ncbi:YeaH/YhbH family protein [Pseudochelatococcus sp. G4_1912]|uniref:YeaH/YhbH family protein n=1 Tax=Pseudochelatococcus sp. G4_1912 TaxID=3114288 RepID=UPI0039C662EB
MHIIDRRLNPGGRSFTNRQRFLRRAKTLVQRAVREDFKNRSIKDLEQGGEVSIVREGVHEPVLRRGSGGGKRDFVLPGNKEYLEGDSLKRPQGGGSGGDGNEAGQGSGEDAFRFLLTRDEYLDLFLDDLELPNLAKRKLTGAESKEIHRAGYSTSGSPSSLSVSRTMRHSLSRRIALRRPGKDAIRALEEEISGLVVSGADPVRLEALKEEHQRLVRRSKRIAYIDPIDLRYRRYESVPRPVAQAVMFCLMDVSGSMSEQMKDLAKRFYALLHIFLRRSYRNVDVVFIRHTDHAEEVDENTFFHSPETGGTIVSTALEEMMKVVRERYNPDDWNIYVAQASDGDNIGTDNTKVAALVNESILPICQYFAYLEVGRGDGHLPTGVVTRTTDLWRAYESQVPAGGHFVMRKVWHRREIYPVFRELFRRNGADGGGA